MASLTSFNPASPRTLHLDLNSAFASMEQQANPLLRGVPTVVAAYSKPFGCILASSKEAKLWGVKTGMTVQEGRKRCPFLVVRDADPQKYRYIHRELKQILQIHTTHLVPKSIDEFVLHLPQASNPIAIGKQIQYTIKTRVGDWLTVSVGVGPNRFLAKLASNLKKDSPLILDSHNHLEIYSHLSLPDLPGINFRLARRLKEQGVFTPLDFYHAAPGQLQAAFRSVLARDWQLRLHGWEIDDWDPARRTFGQSYVLPHPMPKEGWLPILGKLVDKSARRMRGEGYSARGAHLYLRFPHSSWHRGHTGRDSLFTTPDLLRLTTSLFHNIHSVAVSPVKQIAVTFFNLSSLHTYQCALFENTPARHSLTLAADSVNARYGPYTLYLASMLNTKEFVRDAIAFGK